MRRARALRPDDASRGLDGQRFWMGVFTAWGVFMLLFPGVGALLLLAIEEPIVTPDTAARVLLGWPVALALGAAFMSLWALLPAAVLAWPLALALRGTRSRGLHMLCFAALGALIGVAVAGWVLVTSPVLDSSGILVPAAGAVTAIAGAVGSWHLAPAGQRLTRWCDLALRRSES